MATSFGMIRQRLLRAFLPKAGRLGPSVIDSDPMYPVRGTYGFEDAKVTDEFGPRRFIGGAAISTKQRPLRSGL
jgi:hypothetical protein